MRVEPLGDPGRRPERVGIAGTTDAELLHATACGSEAAFEELRRRYQGAVARLCRATFRPGAVEDCSQEVFVRVWQKAYLFDAERGSPAGWLLTLARNVARNLAAKRVPEPVESNLAPELPTGIADREGTGEVDRFWLSAALERLPRHERRVIELGYYDGLTQSEIAEALGTPLGTVKSWTRRGLNRLATLLGDERLP